MNKIWITRTQNDEMKCVSGKGLRTKAHKYIQLAYLLVAIKIACLFFLGRTSVWCKDGSGIDIGINMKKGKKDGNQLSHFDDHLIKCGIQSQKPPLNSDAFDSYVKR